jgi:hypothetical protein
MATVFDQNCRLLRAGKQPKSAYIDNLCTTTDNKPKKGSAVPPRLKPGLPTPQN